MSQRKNVLAMNLGWKFDGEGGRKVVCRIERHGKIANSIISVYEFSEVFRGIVTSCAITCFEECSRESEASRVFTNEALEGINLMIFLPISEKFSVMNSNVNKI
jgi:hypothetical protein